MQYKVKKGERAIVIRHELDETYVLPEECADYSCYELLAYIDDNEISPVFETENSEIIS